MNKVEATKVLNLKISHLREKSYEEIAVFLGSQDTEVMADDCGREYQVETQVFFDDKKTGNIRVMVAVDDGGLRAFAPITKDFIVSKDGGFVGE